MRARTERRLTVALQVLSLAAAAWFVWFHSAAPRLSYEPPGAVVARAVFYLMFVAVCTGAITLSTYLVVSRGSVHPRLRSPLSSLSVAVWYAPAILVASSFSPLSAAASVILVISTTRVMVARWTAHTQHKRSRRFTPPRVLAWRAAAALLASAAVHGAVFALGGDYRLPAVALLAFSASVLTALAMVTGAHTPRSNPALPNSILGVILTMVLALGVTAVRYAAGESDTQGGGRARPSASKKDPARADPRLPRDGDFPGVILFAERPPRPDKLVVPAPARRRSGEPASRTIPFTGEYWLFRAPLHRPPLETSFRAAGSLLDYSFSTTDGFPLLIEARQRLEEPIAIDCCRAFQVTVFTHDLIPGSAWIELAVADSMRAAFGPLTVGRAGLTAGGREVLSFAMPGNIWLSQFDEFRLSIRQAQRANKSLKIKVEGFTLLPRDAGWR
jgi:hypothetical protein